MMNKATWEKDIEACEPGTLIIYNSDAKLPVERDDCLVFPVPMTKMARGLHPKLARMIANMYYVGALVHLLQIDMESVRILLEKQFKGKASAIELNMQAIDEGRMFTEENFGNPQPFRIEAREKIEGQFLVDGNEAGALGSIFGGVNLLSWYPITPSSSLAEEIIAWLCILINK